MRFDMDQSIILYHKKRRGISLKGVIYIKIYTVRPQMKFNIHLKENLKTWRDGGANLRKAFVFMRVHRHASYGKRAKKARGRLKPRTF